MKNVLDQFRALALDIHNHPHLILMEYGEYKPVTQDKIDRVEEELGHPIPNDVKEFYTQTNGLRLSWMHIKDDFYDQDDHFALELPAHFDDRIREKHHMYDMASQHESGSINIQDLEHVFTSPFPMNEELVEEGYYVFDPFSMICGAAISFPNSKDEAVISFNGDHYTHFDDYDISMSFDEYLEFLIKTKGVKGLRTQPKDYSLMDGDFANWPEEFYYNEG